MTARWTSPRGSISRAVAVAAALATLATACIGSNGASSAATAEATAEAESPAADAAEGAQDAPNPSDTAKPDPVPFVPAGRPGSAAAYDELVSRLATEVPASFRAEVPWPDLRHPDPIATQHEIFDLWIWMAGNLPEPALAQIMAAPGSPSREDIATIFGNLDRSGRLETRPGEPYRAFDHRVVTFESAGLPLWLARDVPSDAVVVYYRDSSGPIRVLDRETGEVLDERGSIGTRAWLSIMVPTEVGWQLWRDQLIEPNDAELEMPDLPPPPGADGTRPVPEV